MVDLLDLESEAAKAKAAVTVILTETRLKKPNHEFVKFLEAIENWIYKSHEQHMKKIGEVMELERRIANLSCFEIAELEKPETEMLKYERPTLRIDVFAPPSTDDQTPF